jgi:hypothetical protein
VAKVSPRFSRSMARRGFSSEPGKGALDHPAAQPPLVGGGCGGWRSSLFVEDRAHRALGQRADLDSRRARRRQISPYTSTSWLSGSVNGITCLARPTGACDRCDTTDPVDRRCCQIDRIVPTGPRFGLGRRTNSSRSEPPFHNKWLSNLGPA